MMWIEQGNTLARPNKPKQSLEHSSSVKKLIQNKILRRASSGHSFTTEASQGSGRF